jgi:hypothetical protein
MLIKLFSDKSSDCSCPRPWNTAVGKLVMLAEANPLMFKSCKLPIQAKARSSTEATWFVDTLSVVKRLNVLKQLTGRSVNRLFERSKMVKFVSCDNR